MPASSSNSNPDLESETQLSSRDTSARRLRVPSGLWSLIRFGGASGLGFLVILGTTALLHEIFGLRERFAYAVGLAVGLAFNFTTLRLFVFPGATQKVAVQFGQVAISSVAFRLVEYVLFLVAVEYVKWHYAVTALVVQGGMLLVKHRYYHWLLSRPGVEQPQPGNEPADCALNAG